MIAAEPVAALGRNPQMRAFGPNNGGKWQWPDPLVTYSNASLPHALISTGRCLGREDMVEIGLDVLRWLLSLQTADGHFVPIGNDGWCDRDSSRRARFDQQPIEADTTLGACIEAFRITGDRRWLQDALRTFRWFLGDNDLGVPVYDEATGACFDGLQATGLNQNQGAESTLAWMHALIQMHALQAEGLLEMPLNIIRERDRQTSVAPNGLNPSIPLGVPNEEARNHRGSEITPGCEVTLYAPAIVDPGMNTITDQVSDCEVHSVAGRVLLEVQEEKAEQNEAKVQPTA